VTSVFVILVILLFAFSEAHEPYQPRQHFEVIDGDTIEVAGTRVRLWAIDAPDSRAVLRGGQRATEHLRELVANGEVRCEPHARDHYGRIVALCRVDDRDLGAAKVRDGWALAFVRYSGVYFAREREAKEAARGCGPEALRRGGAGERSGDTVDVGLDQSVVGCGQ
jgi:endonuclease YncB( thermonuclease family)